MYLIIGEVDGHIEEKNESTYLVFDSTLKNRKVLKITQNLGMGLKMKLSQLMVVKTVNMVKTLKKIKFDIDDNLPLNKPLKLCMLTIIVRSVFEKVISFIRKFI